MPILVLTFVITDASGIAAVVGNIQLPKTGGDGAGRGRDGDPSELVRSAGSCSAVTAAVAGAAHYN